MARFDGKTVIITGAGSGLGQADAVRLAQEGANLVLVDMSEEGLAQTKQQVADAGGTGGVEVVTANVTKSADVQKYVDASVEAFGDEEFAKVVAVNLTGVFAGMAAVLKQMRKQGSGSIVNTASVGGIRGVGNQSGYAASKHGVVGLTRNSAREYGEHGISINAIAPGAIMTAMVEGSLRQLGGDNWEEAGREFVSVNPMKRFGKPEEVAALVAFLLSDDSKFINGTVIPIDGGQHAMY